MNLKPADWTKYKGEYEKEEYDIRLKDGTELGPCWPNAGNFNLLDNSGKVIDDSQVTHFRISKNPSYPDMSDSEGDEHIETFKIDGKEIEMYGCYYKDTPVGTYDYYDLFYDGGCINLGDPQYSKPDENAVREILEAYLV